MTHPPLGPEVLNNRYRLLSIVAAGGMAIVFKGHDMLLNRVVAVKVLRESFARDALLVERFHAEAQAAASLSHPNIVTIFDVGREVIAGIEQHYIVMEFVNGYDLRHKLRLGKALDISEAMDIGQQICAGVGYAHRRGFVHCDLKPPNILIGADGIVKITDFGIARAYAAALQTNQPEEMVWGTPTYFAPEQAAGLPPTPASDVYSIGVILYEMLAGRPPFIADDPAALGRLHQQQHPIPLPRLNPLVTPQLWDVVRRALAKDPAQRYRNAELFHVALSLWAQRSEEQTLVNLPPLPPSSTGYPATAPSRTPAKAAKSDTDGPDVLLWLLGALAFLCVVGLIPLGVQVYRAYTFPAPTQLYALPTPSAAANPPTAAFIQARVPLLVGKTISEAAQIVGQLGLTLSVASAQDSTTASADVVIEQRTAPDTLVPIGSVVEVVISRAPELRTVPNGLIGQTLAPATMDALRAAGFTVITREVVDFALREVILSIEPPAGTLLPLSSTLTVTVSSGGRIPLEANLFPVLLESALLPRDTYRVGEAIQFSLTWRGLADVRKDYRVGWYLLDPSGTRALAQGEDRAPFHNGIPAPTQHWTNGTVVNDRYILRIPNTLQPGEYGLYVSMYNEDGRLRVINPGQTTAPSDLVLIYRIRVVG
ncbi:MAG: protein kinase domain-containing protein [Thermoflexales bacterium]